MASTPRPRCNAPFSSLYLDPAGNARACCQNIWQRLGNVADTSLADIWTGDAANELRQRIAADDFGLGCELCAAEVEIGASEAAYYHQFDSLPQVGPSLGWPRQLELALSISCNLQCVMCNGELSSAIRIHREHRPPAPSPYGEGFFEQLDEFLVHAERITFLGGEPFLGPEPLRVLDRLVELGLAPTCHINTNGTQWSERVQRIIARLPVFLAVSVDGRSPEVIEAIRTGVDAERLITNVPLMRAASRRDGSGFALTFCLMKDNWHELFDVLEWGDELDCDVIMNTVTNPPGFSLHHLDRDRLAEVVAALQERDAAALGQLGRNRPTWERTLRHLQMLVDRPEPSAQAGDTASLLRSVRSEAVAWGDTPEITEMQVDASLLIRSISDEAGIAGPAADGLVGQPSVRFIETIGPLLGRLAGTELHLSEAGMERRTFLFTGPAGEHTEVGAHMVQHAAGETWFIATRSAPATAVQPVRIRQR